MSWNDTYSLDNTTIKSKKNSARALGDVSGNLDRDSNDRSL